MPALSYKIAKALLLYARNAYVRAQAGDTQDYDIVYEGGNSSSFKALLNYLAGEMTNKALYRKITGSCRTDSIVLGFRNDPNNRNAWLLTRINKWFAPKGQFDEDAIPVKKEVQAFFDTMGNLDPDCKLPFMWAVNENDYVRASQLVPMNRMKYSFDNRNYQYIRDHSYYGSSGDDVIMTLGRDIQRGFCAETGEPWLRKHLIGGAESLDDENSFYSPLVYNEADYGIPQWEQDRRDQEERDQEEEEEEARNSNHFGRMLNYTANPITQLEGPAFFGHNGIRTYQPETRITGSCKTVSLRYLGVELEVGYTESNWEGRSEAIKWAASVLPSFAIMKSDASIDRVDGFEIVSCPAVLSAHLVQWKAFLEKAHEHVAGYPHDCCGMHVHVSRDSLTNLQLGRMIVFINSKANERFIDRIAGRGSVNYSYRAPKTLVCGNGYQEPRGGYTRRGINTQGHSDALNLSTGKPTVEFRIFRSNVSKSGFFKNLEFVDALCVYASICGNRNLGYREFCDWAETRAKGYPNLVAFLRRTKYLKDSVPDRTEKRRKHNLESNTAWLNQAAA